jgi:hypothetical protein
VADGGGLIAAAHAAGAISLDAAAALALAATQGPERLAVVARAVPAAPLTIPLASASGSASVGAGDRLTVEHWLRMAADLSDKSRPLSYAPIAETDIALILGPPGETALPGICSLSPDPEPEAETACVLAAAGRLWLSGQDLAWPALAIDQGLRRVPLPTYPFERTWSWVDEAPAPARLSSLERMSA